MTSAGVLDRQSLVRFEPSPFDQAADPATRASQDQHFKESAAPGDVHNI